jgi:UDP-MurNAc hydroxylase
MTITFVGHASVLIEEAGIGLLIDPWIKGDAFNESWALYPPAVLNTDALARVTHIWISHEHPDHLSIPTLKSFSPELKSQIVVLFQKHYDTEIVDWLKSQGFRDAKEMPHGNWVPLSPGIEAVCYQIGHMDSALAVRTPRQTILNLNDCDTPVSTLARLKRQLGSVDLLLDQFSIAGWPGNPDELERGRAAASHVMENLITDVEQISPRYVLPFASFVRFSHKENAFMNSVVNTIDDVAEKIDPNRLVVMYPGDSWDLDSGRFVGTDAAIDKYRHAWSQVAEQKLKDHEPSDMPRILAAANDRINGFRQNYPEARSAGHLLRDRSRKSVSGRRLDWRDGSNACREGLRRKSVVASGVVHFRDALRATNPGCLGALHDQSLRTGVRSSQKTGISLFIRLLYPKAASLRAEATPVRVLVETSARRFSPIRSALAVI